MDAAREVSGGKNGCQRIQLGGDRAHAGRALLDTQVRGRQRWETRPPAALLGTQAAHLVGALGKPADRGARAGQPARRLRRSSADDIQNRSGQVARRVTEHSQRHTWHFGRGSIDGFRQREDRAREQRHRLHTQQGFPSTRGIEHDWKALDPAVISRIGHHEPEGIGPRQRFLSAQAALHLDLLTGGRRQPGEPRKKAGERVHRAAWSGRTGL